MSAFPNTPLMVRKLIFSVSMSHPYGRNNERRLVSFVRLVLGSGTDRPNCSSDDSSDYGNNDCCEATAAGCRASFNALQIRQAVDPLNCYSHTSNLHRNPISGSKTWWVLGNILSCPYSLRPIQLGLLIWVLQLHFFIMMVALTLPDLPLATKLKLDCDDHRSVHL